MKSKKKKKNQSLEAHIQKIEYWSQFPHGPEVVTRQLRRRGRFYQRRHDLAALLWLRRRRRRRLLAASLPLGGLRPSRLRRRVQACSRANGTGARGAVPGGGGRSSIGGGSGGVGGCFLLVRIGFRRGFFVVLRGRSLGHGVRERSKGF